MKPKIKNLKNHPYSPCHKSTFAALRILIFAYTFLQLSITFSYGQVERMEPPFWWAGMKNENLQILLYEHDISTFSATSQDLNITSVDSVKNKNYLILNVNLAGKKPGMYKITLDNGKKKRDLIYELKERKKYSAERKGFDSSDMLYLIMPDRFANGNPANDKSKGLEEPIDRNGQWSRHGGDLKGIHDHLDYIAALGATGVWNTPSCESNSPHKYGSYHGYAQTDVYKIDPRFGTNEKYVALSKALKKRNMKLVKDYVMNHWSTNHWMMKDLPDTEWVNLWDEMTYAKHSKEIFSDPYAAKTDFKYVTQGWFDTHMMDLNITQPLLLKYLIQNAIWWIEYADLDGLRVDTYPYNDKNAITAWATAVYDEYPHFSIVAESWVLHPPHISYWQKDSPIAAIQGFNSQVNVVKDFALFDAFSNAFTPDHTWQQGLRGIHHTLQFDFLYQNVNDLLIFAENHDTQRINTTYPKFQDYKLIMTLLATLRGIPQLYYGSEIGMQGDKGKGDGDIRRDFPGGWDEDRQNAFNASERTPHQQKYFDFTAKLFNWRKTATVVHQGKTLHYIPEEEVYVFFRYLEGKRIMVIVNGNTKEQLLKINRYTEGIENFTTGKEVITGKVFLLQNDFEIPAKTAYILTLN